MLFNSHEFIFLFLPVAFLTFYVFGKYFGPNIAMVWLVAASIFFYAWWNPVYVWLILLSMLFNYGVGRALSANSGRRGLLALGVVANLALLGYYKYANFFVNTVNDMTGTSFDLHHIMLPLAISFFTFQQIAYLADACQGKTEEHKFLHYALFVTFFPQLIAGPIVHHAEMMRQFSKLGTFRFDSGKMEMGLTIFSLGLFKKVLLADGIARYATPVFQAAFAGESITVIDAWTGALGYSFQLYFDFSAYSDMAIGLALMFGIRLPVNFMSPYKAVNIIEFWRRWHMTLARFLRDYLYIPLGGNRKGKSRRYVNLMITMLLGGLWHGAGWTFSFWGGLHGCYLVANHGWHHIRRLMGHDLEKSTLWGRILARGITFLAVVIGWVYFRADSFESANLILSTMFGFQHVSILGTTLFPGRVLHQAFVWFIALAMLIWLMPNVLQWTGYIESQHEWKSSWIPRKLKSLLQFRATTMWAIFCSVLMVFSILKLTHVSEFLYFQF